MDVEGFSSIDSRIAVQVASLEELHNRREELFGNTAYENFSHELPDELFEGEDAVTVVFHEVTPDASDTREKIVTTARSTFRASCDDVGIIRRLVLIGGSKLAGMVNDIRETS